MEHGFWHAKWDSGQIGFHQDRPNAMLVEHFPRLAVAAGASVFVPMCGKTRDIHWLLDHGYRVVGAELSEKAVRQLFDDLGQTPEATMVDGALRLSGPRLTVHVGDIFALKAGDIGPVDAVFDRAALIALPDDMRLRYARHLGALSGHAPQILVTLTYDQDAMDGPPFSVTADEVEQRYSDAYSIELLEQAEVSGGLKGRIPATQTAWLLSPK
ncbi:thiopurine S-methyltransferase [Oceaniglobus indicus]|uniref:thiopurine S-methyltransferase n=1 Tax=Oceaniglobus indicus TaxID=2047749 RepID=UPI000C18AF70|nr:thiopurine S-methyltransferase [Oceaniglobus indicus]